MQSESIMCECVFLAAARGYLLISHARARVLPRPNAQATAPFSPLAGSNYSYCLRFFFSLRPLYLWIIASKKLLFIIDLASHRIASFHRFVSVSMRIELPHCAWPLLIYYHVICYLFSRSTAGTFNFTAQETGA